MVFETPELHDTALAVREATESAANGIIDLGAINETLIAWFLDGDGDSMSVCVEQKMYHRLRDRLNDACAKLQKSMNQTIEALDILGEAEKGN